MNIEIANRLVQLRKQNGLSQEALAEKLGISRQAVSKWERAEASPDTDNIILLARLYGVSLDELLQTEDEIPRPDPEEIIEQEQSAYRSETGSVGADVGAVTYDIVGIGAVGGTGESGAAGDANSGYGSGMDGFVGAEGYGESAEGVPDRAEHDVESDHRKQFARMAKFPFAAFIAVLYIFLGACFHAWHPAWLLFLLIPIWHSLVQAIMHKRPTKVAYPVVVTLLYLCLGFFCGLWHPGWVVFLTIPLYYPLVSFFYPNDKD